MSYHGKSTSPSSSPSPASSSPLPTGIAAQANTVAVYNTPVPSKKKAKVILKKAEVVVQPTAVGLFTYENIAPPGFHFMPDGTLMADEAMLAIESVLSLELDTSSLGFDGGSRSLIIKSDEGAPFAIEIKDSDGKYYNFITKTFGVNSFRFSSVMSKQKYSVGINFPQVTSADQYDIYIWSEKGSKHQNYKEVRFLDGSLDINSSSGSNSFLVQKVIHQKEAVTLTVGFVSPSGTIEAGTLVTKTIDVDENKSTSKTQFSISCSVTTAAKCYRLAGNNVTDQSIISFTSPEIGASPLVISQENIYPAITTAANSTTNGGTTVNGSSTGTTVTTHVVSSTIATLGDRVLGNAALAAKTVTVTAISGGSGKTFTISEAISIADDLPLTFSNQVNYRWPISSVLGLKNGQSLLTGTNVAANSLIANYKDSTLVFQGTPLAREIVKNTAKSLTLTNKATVVKENVTIQPGTIIFNNPQVLALAGDTVRIGAYGFAGFKQIYGYDVVVDNLKIALTPITTTTTSAVENSTSVPVASRNGILDGISTVSGIGINKTVINPTVDSGAGAVTGAGTLVLSSAQTLEKGAVLTFASAGQTATITGNIQILKAGTVDAVMSFDIDQLLSIT